MQSSILYLLDKHKTEKYSKLVYLNIVICKKKKNKTATKERVQFVCLFIKSFCKLALIVIAHLLNKTNLHYQSINGKYNNQIMINPAYNQKTK